MRFSALLENDRRTELIGRGLALDTVRRDQPDAPWADPAPGLRGRLYLGHMTDLVDPVIADVDDAHPVEHRWTPAAQTTVFRGFRQERFVLGDAFVCDIDAPVRFSGPFATSRVHRLTCLTDTRPDRLEPATIHVDTTISGGRIVVGLGASAGAARAAAERAAGATAEDARRAFDAELDALAPTLVTDDHRLARLYAYRVFVAWRALQRPDRWWPGHPMPGELIFEGPTDPWFSKPIGLPLSLQIRELRWLRAPEAVAGTLAAWTAGSGVLRAYAGDPVSPALDYVRHHPGVLDVAALERAALEYLTDPTARTARIRGGGLHAFPLTVGSWVTGTEFAPDFFVDSGLERSEIAPGIPALLMPGEPDTADLPAIHRADVDTFHATMLRAIGRPAPDLAALHAGPDGIFRSAGIDSVVGFDAAVPFSFGEFSPAHRDGLLHALSPAHLGGPHGIRSTSIQSPGYCPDNRWGAFEYPCCWNGPVWNYASSWVLLSLGRVARSTNDPRLLQRFGELFHQWSDSHGDLPLAVEHLHPDTGRAFRVVPEYFHSAWLAPFLEHVVGVGHPSRRTAFPIPDLTLHDVPFEGDAVRVDVVDQNIGVSR